MDKTYHFLSGLPRSGNTLLSSLLNQNPIIYSSPISPVAGYMWNWYDESHGKEQIHRNIENSLRSENVLKNFLNNFYADVNTPIVIDREKLWGIPLYLDFKSSKFLVLTFENILLNVTDNSSAISIVSLIALITSYGFALDAGRLSSRYPFHNSATNLGTLIDAPLSLTPQLNL